MIFLRHPKPDIEPGICYGRTDLDIAAEGHEQIEEALRKTPKVKKVVASPALRCRKLAMTIAERDRADLRFDERLWEMHMGEWEGLAWSEIDRSASEHWLEDPISRPTPGGECFADLQNRVAEALAEIADEHAMTTAVVCHAGPIRATQMAWEAISFSEAFSQVPGYAEPVRLLNPAWISPTSE